MKTVFLSLIRLYQRAISPFFVSIFGVHCRFTPTCSEYTYQAIEKHGIMRGLRLGIKRLLQCHPWNPGGYDPV